MENIPGVRLLKAHFSVVDVDVILDYIEEKFCFIIRLGGKSAIEPPPKDAL